MNTNCGGERPAHKRQVRGAGGKPPPVGWWDEEIDDGAETLGAALRHPVRQGQGIALSDNKTEAKDSSIIRVKT